MSARPGEATGRLLREQARERHEQAVHLLDAEAIRRVLSGCPAWLTELERDAVVTIADVGGLSREITARGLGVSEGALDWAITRRRRATALTRDLMAAAALRPAADLVEAVAARAAGAVARVLSGLDRQRPAALAVVLALMTADADPDSREPVAA